LLAGKGVTWAAVARCRRRCAGKRGGGRGSVASVRRTKRRRTSLPARWESHARGKPVPRSVPYSPPTSRGGDVAPSWGSHWPAGRTGHHGLGLAPSEPASAWWTAAGYADWLVPSGRCVRRKLAEVRFVQRWGGPERAESVDFSAVRTKYSQQAAATNSQSTAIGTPHQLQYSPESAAEARFQGRPARPVRRLGNVALPARDRANHLRNSW
jgi:hypothetical protein